MKLIKKTLHYLKQQLRYSLLILIILRFISIIILLIPNLICKLFLNKNYLSNYINFTEVKLNYLFLKIII